jgi:hypothetical protein
VPLLMLHDRVRGVVNLDKKQQAEGDGATTGLKLRGGSGGSVLRYRYR